jgi:hypothetical protein
MARAVGKTLASTMAGETVAAFVPDPLPPSKPPLALDIGDVLPRAEHAISRLDLAGEMRPSDAALKLLSVAKKNPEVLLG